MADEGEKGIEITKRTLFSLQPRANAQVDGRMADNFGLCVGIALKKWDSTVDW